jgi:hypothetical protein
MIKITARNQRQLEKAFEKIRISDKIWDAGLKKLSRLILRTQFSVDTLRILEKQC